MRRIDINGPKALAAAVAGHEGVTVSFINEDGDTVDWIVRWGGYQLEVAAINYDTNQSDRHIFEAPELSDVEAWAAQVWPDLKEMQLWVD